MWILCCPRKKTHKHNKKNRHLQNVICDIRINSQYDERTYFGRLRVAMVADEGFAGFAVLPLKLQGQNNFKSNNITHGKEKRKCKILVTEGL